MWQCPVCAESLEDSFDTCWKCGTSSTRHRDPAFRISEPATAQDQSLDSVAEAARLPDLRLPTATYFAIPPFIWLSLIYFAIDFREKFVSPNRLQLDFGVSPITLVLWAVAMLLVGVPVGFVFLRGMFLRIMRKQIGGSYWSDVSWIISLFRLPDLYHRKYRWFVWVYYFSIIAYLGSAT